MSILQILGITILFLILIWIITGETQRRQGKLNPSLKKYYKSTNFALAPINLWCGNNSYSSGYQPLPDMLTFFNRHWVLKNKWEKIRDEAMNLYKNGYTTKINKDLFFSNIADNKWKKFYIKWYSDPLPDAQQLCPETVALIKSLPEVHLAMFSILDPGAKIIPHHGVWKNTIRYHLGLSCPTDTNRDNCSILIDGNIRYSWKDGQDVLFDDTYVHEVENNTNEPRIILLCDVERTMVSSFSQKINHIISTTLGPLTTKKNDKVERMSLVGTYGSIPP
jgi:aspartyl/asparaginyl beta-hydroxylase (cupin superfamily)